jgi:hypothetical protein
MGLGYDLVDAGCRARKQLAIQKGQV